MKSASILLILLMLTGLLAAGGPKTATSLQKTSTTTSYVITDDDLPGKVGATGVTLFPIGSGGTLGNSTRVSLGGAGIGGGYFDASRVNVFDSSNDACAFAALGGPSAIGAVDINAQQDIGNFSGSPTDSAGANGIGLVNNGTYLYANFTGSNTIATFAIMPGCGLNFLGDINALGKQKGNVKGMAVRGNLMVVAYGDGSIQSFNLSGGIPVSNGDLQNASGFSTDRFPIGVDITSDGHYAIFGDESTTTTVEVSNLSSGKLSKTVLYNMNTAANSANIYLSPDETLLYIGNTGTGQLTAAFFNATTGKITPGCTSGILKGFDNTWIFLGSVVTELNTGTGSVVYLAEYGSVSGVAEVGVTSSGGKCTLKEISGSPVQDPNSTTLLSIGVYPPRQF
jgi:6-phosphogluconolactonase (cycloisomerase 2 family)